MSLEEQGTKENFEVPKDTPEKQEEQELTREEFLNATEAEKTLFFDESNTALKNINTVAVSPETFERIKNETNIEDSVGEINDEAEQVIHEVEDQIAEHREMKDIKDQTAKEVAFLENRASTVGSPEITQEFVDGIVLNEMKRYVSPQAMERAKRIDSDFPATKLEKLFNPYKLQEKNLSEMVQNPSVKVVDFIPENMGGHYQRQPLVRYRNDDFIEVTDRADPTQLQNIIEHEYNHLVTRGENNFSSGYKVYIESLFYSQSELKKMGKKEETAWLNEEPFEGVGPLRKYLTNPAEVSAYLSTNLRGDLLRNGIIKNFYDQIPEDVFEMAVKLPSHYNRPEQQLYSKYASIIKDKQKFIHWLNHYAI